jgi:uncharacterized membrane protein
MQSWPFLDLLLMRGLGGYGLLSDQVVFSARSESVMTAEPSGVVPAIIRNFPSRSK